jgi:hypothetical protein
MVSQAWKELSPPIKAEYYDIACQDRNRYEAEKKQYKGPWKIVTDKDLSEPKKPSAPFLMYMQSIRSRVRNNNPGLVGDQITRLIAHMWKDAPQSTREEYATKFRQQWEQYQCDLQRWNSSRATNAAAQFIDTGLGDNSSEYVNSNTNDTVNRIDVENTGSILGIATWKEENPLVVSMPHEYANDTPQWLPETLSNITDSLFSTPLCFTRNHILPQPLQMANITPHQDSRELQMHYGESVLDNNSNQQWLQDWECSNSLEHCRYDKDLLEKHSSDSYPWQSDMNHSFEREDPFFSSDGFKCMDHHPCNARMVSLSDSSCAHDSSNASLSAWNAMPLSLDPERACQSSGVGSMTTMDIAFDTPHWMEESEPLIPLSLSPHMNACSPIGDSFSWL